MSEPSQKEAAKPLRSRRIMFVVVLSAALVALELMWFTQAQDEKKAVLELAQPERAALYARTRQTLETVCAPQSRPKGLTSFCRDQATLIAAFPECDAACQSLAKTARKAGKNKP